MTSADLNPDNVLVRISPQIITGEGPDVAAARASSGASSALGRRLLLAARAGDTAGVLELMAKGAPFTTDWLGTSALHLAAQGAHVETCGVLLRGGVSRDARSKLDRTAMHVAAAAGHERVVELLLAHGADADARDMLRMTPLHWALVRRHAPVARLLLQHGADVAAVTKFRHSARHLALRSGCADLLEMVDEALKEQDTARSLKALTAEQAEKNPVEIPMITENIEEQIEKPAPKTKKQIKITLPKLDNAGAKSTSSETAANDESGAQILRRHGITLLPPDTGGTVARALQSGRTVVLSDAGKLVLAQSGADGGSGRGRGAAGKGAAVSSVTGPRGRVVLRAVPVRGAGGAQACKAGAAPLRLLTLNKPHQHTITKLSPQQLQKLKVVGVGNARGRPPASTRRLVLRPHNSSGGAARPHSNHVTSQPAPTPARLATYAVTVPLNAATTLRNPTTFEQVVVRQEGAGAGTEAVSGEAHAVPDEADAVVTSQAADGGGGEEAAALRAALGRALATVDALTAQLRDCRARLAKYEPVEL